MFKPILLLALIAFVAAAPAPAEDETEQPEVIAILKSEQNQNPDGSYSFLFESGDGSAREENGEIVNQGTDEEGIKITGSYRYIDANGEEVVVTYTADENGFVPVGTNIAKEISDAALAARDLPNDEPEPQSRSAKSIPVKAVAPPAKAAPPPAQAETLPVEAETPPVEAEE